MKKWRHSIQSKITLGYAIIILSIFVAFIAVNFQLQKLQSERITIVDEGLKIQTLTNRIEQNMYEMENNRSAYAITKKKKYANAYKVANDHWDESYDLLYPLLNERPEQLKQLRDIRENLDLWAERMDDQIQKNSNDIQVEEESITSMNALHNEFENLRLVENIMIKQRTDVLNSRNTQIATILFSTLAGIALIAAILAKIISKTITNSITRVTKTIQLLATSPAQFEQRIAITSNDEVKDLAKATNLLLDNVGKREWLLSHLNNVVASYQGVTSIMKLAEIFLTEMSIAIGATYSVFYVRSEEDVFKKKASFAENGNAFGRAQFKVGEGLIGQVVKSGEMYITEKIPEGIPLVKTGIGDLKPTTLLISPILHDGQVIGVAEFASMDQFSVIGRELLVHVNNTLGLTIDSVMRRREIVKLLNESRRLTLELQVKTEEMFEQSKELQLKSEELTSMNSKLEARTNDAETKSAELEQIKQDLEGKSFEIIQSSKYKSEFLANISHELRTPLNSILLLSEMMKDNQSMEISEEVVEFATIIHSSGQDLLELINDILDLSKTDAGKLHIEFSEVSMREFQGQLLSKFGHQAIKNNLEFTISIDDTMTDLFYTDEMRLQQIVKNFISNAFKFTESGSVQVRIHKENKLTTEMRTVSEDWLVIEVIDTGIGIPIEKQAIIFDSFQQADGATARKYGGTGLGLAICKEFTKLLGGFIKLDSVVGEGSRFTLSLPSAKNNSTQMEVGWTGISELPPLFNNKRALIVDHDYQNIFILRRILENSGLIITVAENGYQAIEALQVNVKYDIVLMDIMEPGITECDTVQKIRENLKFFDLPIIMVTTSTEESELSACRKAGVTDFIRKPLETMEIIEMFQKWLGSNVT